MDLLSIDGIVLHTHIGVSESERSTVQTILVDVHLPVDAGATARHDSLDNGIDYAAVVATVLSCASAERNTIERLAEDIARAVLERHGPPRVEVRVRKKPADLDGATATLTIVRP